MISAYIDTEILTTFGQGLYIYKTNHTTYTHIRRICEDLGYSRVTAGLGKLH